jgi:uncharacterized membrane protein
LPPVFALAMDLSPRVMTFLISMLPISELRGAIPYAIWVGKLGWKEAYVIAVIGNLGLTMFVAIPLPVTGAWTGCAAAIIFGIPRKLAIPAIFLGVMIAGGIVTLASLGVISFWGIRGQG